MSQLQFIGDATEDGKYKISQLKSMQDQTGLATMGVQA